MPCPPRRPDQREGINKEHDDAKQDECELQKFICRRHVAPPRLGMLLGILVRFGTGEQSRAAALNPLRRQRREGYAHIPSTSALPQCWEQRVDVCAEGGQRPPRVRTRG